MTEHAYALGLSDRFMRVARGGSTLFDLGDAELQVLAAIEDAEERGEDASDALAELAVLETALAEKVEGYVSVIRQLEHLSKARKSEADRLRQRATSAERAADWLTNRLKVHMETTGQQRIETSRFTISLRQNPPRVDVLEEQMIPAEFKRTVITTSVDKRAILDHVKATGEIPDGVEVARGTRVAIS